MTIFRSDSELCRNGLHQKSNPGKCLQCTRIREARNNQRKPLGGLHLSYSNVVRELATKAWR